VCQAAGSQYDQASLGLSFVQGDGVVRNGRAGDSPLRAGSKKSGIWPSLTQATDPTRVTEVGVRNPARRGATRNTSPSTFDPIQGPSALDQQEAVPTQRAKPSGRRGPALQLDHGAAGPFLTAMRKKPPAAYVVT